MKIALNLSAYFSGVKFLQTVFFVSSKTKVNEAGIWNSSIIDLLLATFSVDVECFKWSLSCRQH